MVHIANDALFLHVPGSKKRKLSRLGIASLLATSVLAATTVAQARTTQIQITSRDTAFGGHSFAGVGQYEFITGVATGEVSPTNPQNAVITASSSRRETRGATSFIITISTFCSLWTSARATAR